MATTPKTGTRTLRKALAVSALVVASALNLAACGTPVQHANLGRCANLPGSGGSLCEEQGTGQYIFVDRLTGLMRRYTPSEAQLLAQATVSLASAQATSFGGSNGGQRNCLSNPSIACSGALNNRMSGYRSAGFTSVCSGGQCLSMGR